MTDQSLVIDNLRLQWQVEEDFRQHGPKNGVVIFCSTETMERLSKFKQIKPSEWEKERIGNWEYTKFLPGIYLMFFNGYLRFRGQEAEIFVNV